FLQSKEPRGVIGIVEDVGGRLIDGDGAGVGRGVGDLSAMQAQGGQFQWLFSHERLSGLHSISKVGQSGMAAGARIAAPASGSLDLFPTTGSLVRCSLKRKSGRCV